ncbi:Outer membrane lipoprotein-sorting protein [hydrothermal vent metagenome]|uniref:Outer membrane lipoprotein-sorting protein n=1 Tax=hydrothermal vent metagenome TaxID=652676 RepID=A0A3B1ALU6_9ZZZZ
MKNINLLKLITLTLLPLTLLFSNHVLAETAEEKGKAIAIKADKLDSGWNDMKTKSVMILRNRHGQETTRRTHGKNLEVTGDGDKTLVVFDNPRDVKGTAFLTWSHSLKSDDQWLFLPALKRVKRISSSNKSGPFMGSEFAYEDISSNEVDKYTYKYIKNEKINDRDAFVIERYPQYKHTGYTKMVTWVDTVMYQPIKIDFYDLKNSLLKTLTYHGYKQYLNKYWRPDQMKVVNHQTGKSTVLNWEKYEFNTGLKSRDFDRNSLKRAR